MSLWFKGVLDFGSSCFFFAFWCLVFFDFGDVGVKGFVTLGIWDRLGICGFGVLGFVNL